MALATTDTGAMHDCCCPIANMFFTEPAWAGPAVISVTVFEVAMNVFY